ncbi:NAD-dependent epimerase/dehydratase family protein [Micromonospora sp. DT229]|uniref:NAD-dependent epimerase/dehydratase family protein n=1 Tax=Micromonospora sp. DT229 TaxID=3393430 RepID=UPI003CEF94D5
MGLPPSEAAICDLTELSQATRSLVKSHSQNVGGRFCKPHLGSESPRYSGCGEHTLSRNTPGRRSVVVLGGTGSVGRHVCAEFARSGHHVVAVARHPGREVNCHDFIALDLTAVGAARVLRMLQGTAADVVVNATDGANDTDGWDRSEAELATANMDLVRTLLDAVAAAPRRPRLVHVGTIHEYGPVPAGTMIDESVPPRPVTAYGRTKLAGSTAVLEATASGRVDGVVLRAVNLCGPYPSAVSLPGKLLGMLDDAARTGRMPIAIAPASRDFVDVRDLATAVRLASERSRTAGVFNIGSGVAVPLRHLITLFVTGAGFPESVIEDRSGTVTSMGGSWTQADTRRAREELGWAPRIALADSLREMWLAHRRG